MRCVLVGEDHGVLSRFIQMKPALALPVVTLRPTGLSPSEQKLTEMQHSVLSSLEFLIIIIIILFQ